MNQDQLPYGVTKEKKEPNVIRSFSFPLICSKAQANLLHHVLDLGYEIRSRVVGERIKNREENLDIAEKSKRDYLTLSIQRKTIAAWMKSDDRFKLIHSQVAQNICERIDKGDKKWLKALKKGGRKAKPSRHRDRKDFRSITYPQYGNGVRLKSGKIWFSKLGTFKLHDYQKVVGEKKTVSIVWKQGRFWATITTEIAARNWFPSPASWQEKPTVGGDPGLSTLMSLSDGRVFNPPRRLKEAFKQLRTIQKSVSRKLEARKKAWEADQVLAKVSGISKIPLRDYPRSNRLKADIRRLAKAHTKVERCRDYDHAKIAAILSKEYSQLALEEHGLTFMIQNRKQAKSASDRAIGKMKARIASTLGSDRLYLVTTRDEKGGGNSQTCTCGETVKKDLKDRIHACPSCGRVGNRDIVAADRVHLRVFGGVTQVLGQSVCERGEHKSHAAKRQMGESLQDGFRVFGEAQTSQASLLKVNTKGGEPTLEDKTSFMLESKKPQ